MEDVIGLIANAYGFSAFMIKEDHSMTFYQYIYQDFVILLSSKLIC